MLRVFRTVLYVMKVALRLLVIVVVTALAVAGFSYYSQHHAKAPSSEEAEGEEEEDLMDISLSAVQVKTAGLLFGAADERDVESTLRVNGQIVLRAKDKGSVSSLMAGIVKRILVTDGQHVAKGQTVAMVENTDVVSLQREYYSASKECEFARKDVERQQKLSQNGAGIQRNLEQAERELHVAQARMQGIARQLAQVGIGTESAARGEFITSFPVKAPMAGTVTGITASLGSYVDMQTPLMAIRDNGAVECDLNVYEKDINKIKNGDAVLLTVTNQPGKTVYGRVYGKNTYFNGNSKAVAVHVKLERGADNLFDGQYVSGSIAVGRQRSTTLPVGAIVKSEGKSYVFALNGKPDKQGYHFSRHEVTVEQTTDDMAVVELCKHLGGDKEIVTGNAFYLASLIGEHGEE